MTFWHYTCKHCAEGIRRDGKVRPGSITGNPAAWWVAFRPVRVEEDVSWPLRRRLGSGVGRR